MPTRLDESFFARPTQTVAQELIGSQFVWQGQPILITETEAYVGRDDPACHAARGKTKRNEVMFGKPGLLYVYLIYGMHHCLNIVTEEDGFPAAVLIRGGIHLNNRALKMDGPGKFCRAMDIHREHNWIDITQSDDCYCLPATKSYPIDHTPRIGIREGTDKLWRYVIPKETLKQLVQSLT